MMSFDWLRRHIRDFDFLMVIILLGISVISTLAIYSTTAHRQGMENWVVREIVWQIISYLFMFAFVLVDYRVFRNRVPLAGYGISLFLLVIVFAFPTSHGAHSWIPLPGFQFQPSEFAKLFVIMTIADYMSKAKAKEEPFGWKHLGFISAVVLVPFLLILKQPALGQALVLLGILFSMLIMVMEKRQLIWLSMAAVSFAASIVLVTDVYPQQSVQMIDRLPLAQHQKERILTFLNPKADPTGIGFQVIQAEIAVGSGQLLGQGFLHGTQTQGSWVPEQWTDFIFSAIGEESGFVGASLLIFLFALLQYRMIRIAQQAKDNFAILFISGAVGMYAFQIFENIGMNLTIMPVAGITLPFVSYGGSSLLTNFVVVGIVLSVAIRRRTLVF